MSLFKRPGSRYYQVKLKHHGRVIKRSTGTAVKADARKFQEELRARLEGLRKSGDPTFNDAAIRWLEEKSHKRSIVRDVEIITWFKDEIGDTLMIEITRDVVMDLRRKLLVGRSQETVNRYMALLRAVLRIARDDWEWVTKIPKVPMYPKPDPNPTWLSPEQVGALMPQLPEHTRSAAWFALFTGLRARPILSLQWTWVQRDGIHLPAMVMKNAKTLTIPLSPDAWHVLAEQWGQHAYYVFTYHGEPIKEKFTTAAWRKAVVRAGLPGVRFHDLRHTWASWHAQSGTPMEVVQKLGGWSTYEAMRIYAHHSPASLGEWAGNASRGLHLGATENRGTTASI